MRASAAIGAQLFGSSDGIQPGSFLGTTPRAVKSRDGRLWFLTAEGIASIDPQHFPHNTIPPPVHVEYAHADGRYVDVKRSASLPPTTRSLEIDYSANSFTDPERVFFRYHLEGFDPNWVEAGTRRQAFYTNLRPGGYRFQVVACNNDGLWNEEGASFSFQIEPAFLQTRLFIWIAAGFGMLFLWTVYRVRFHVTRTLPLGHLVGVYPTGYSGAGLLLLRVVVGLTLLVQAILQNPLIASLSPDRTHVARTLEACGGILLMVGLATPFAGALLTLVSIIDMVQRAATEPAYSSLNSPFQYAVFLVMVLGAVTLMGPGHYSADAHLFGKRRTTVKLRKYQHKK